MSENTGERMARMEQDVKHIKSSLEDIKKSIVSMDDRYSSKWVEAVAKATIGLICGAVLTSLIYLVLT